MGCGRSGRSGSGGCATRAARWWRRSPARARACLSWRASRGLRAGDGKWSTDGVASPRARVLVLLLLLASSPARAGSESLGGPEADFRHFKDWAWFALGAAA